MKYKVLCSIYDNDYWTHRYDTIIVEANSLDEVRKIIYDKSTYFEEYYIDHIEELEDDECD